MMRRFHSTPSKHFYAETTFRNQKRRFPGSTCNLLSQKGLEDGNQAAMSIRRPSVIYVDILKQYLKMLAPKKKAKELNRLLRCMSLQYIALNMFYPKAP